VIVMEDRPSPAPSALAVDAASTAVDAASASADGAPTPADELPGLYREVLDRVAALERIGERSQAGRIRMAATAAYSDAWNESGRTRLIGLIGRADRTIAGHDRPRGWTLRRRSVAAR
jgi:hypothetical protein